jgi:peroxiredoxin
MTARMCRTRAGVVFGLILALAPVCQARAGGPPAATRTVVQSPAAFDDVLNQANLMLRQRNYEEALKLFKRANGMKNNSSVECLWGMAQAYSSMRATKNVVETCDQVVQLAGDDRKMVGSAHNLRGLSIFTQARETRDRKKYTEAEAAFRRALEAMPDLHVAHYNLGTVLMCEEQDGPGVDELKLYLAGEPRGPHATQAQRLIDNPRRARENYAPDFSVVTLDDAYLSSDDLRGKVVVLDFWATWCQPCVAGLDDVARLAKRYAKESVVLLSISADTDQAKWRDFVAKNKMTWPQYYDGRRTVQAAFGVNAYPTYFVIDQEGIVRAQAIGTNRFSDVVDAVKTCLKQPPPPK